MTTYTIERRMVKVQSGWFSSKDVPVWCLIEHGTRYEYTNGGSQVYCDSYDYSKVILQSEDKDYVIKEFLRRIEWKFKTISVTFGCAFYLSVVK